MKKIKIKWKEELKDFDRQTAQYVSGRQDTMQKKL